MQIHKRISIYYTFLLCLSLLFVSMGCKSTSKISNNKEQALFDTFDSMISLLGKKKYVDLISNYAHPERLKRMKEDDPTLEKIAEKFNSDGSADELMGALKKCKDLKPTWNEDKTKATFEHSDFPRDVDMVYINGRWYLN